MPCGFQNPASQKGRVESMMGNVMSEGFMPSHDQETTATRTAVAKPSARHTHVLIDMSPKSFCSYSPMSFWMGMCSLSSMTQVPPLSRDP